MCPDHTLKDPVRIWRHEMNNLMNALQLSVAVLRTTSDKTERLMFIEQVEVAAQNIISLLDSPPGFPEQV